MVVGLCNDPEEGSECLGPALRGVRWSIGRETRARCLPWGLTLLWTDEGLFAAAGARARRNRSHGEALVPRR
jgi:hypothetical protein